MALIFLFCMLAFYPLGLYAETITFNPNIVVQSDQTFQIEALPEKIVLNSPANCMQRCFVGYATCIRDNLPTTVNKQTVTVPAATTARTTAGNCARFIEGFCYNQCPTVMNQIQTIRNSYNLPAVTRDSTEFSSVVIDVSNLCENRPQHMKGYCRGGLLKHLLPQFAPGPSSAWLDQLIEAETVTQNEAGALGCEDRCIFEKFVCQRDNLPSSITGNQFTVGHFMQASFTLRVCNIAMHACDDKCETCELCRTFFEAGDQSTFDALKCGQAGCGPL